MHANCKLLFARYAQPLFRADLRVLEIGPDSFPSSYQQMVANGGPAWHTLDIRADERLTYSSSEAHRFPIADGAYDIVLAGSVLEHVRKPWLWIREVGRVCKTGGHVVVIVPVSWPYHEAPLDCWRIYPAGMSALLEEAGLAVIENRFESLETPGYTRYRPGKSLDCHAGSLRWFYSLAGRLGFPVERAYDTIAIARKPGGGGGRQSTGWPRNEPA